MVKRLFCSFMIVFTSLSHIVAGIVEGNVKDARTGETLVGASVMLADGRGTSTNVDGYYKLDGV